MIMPLKWLHCTATEKQRNITKSFTSMPYVLQKNMQVFSIAI